MKKKELNLPIQTIAIGVVVVLAVILAICLIGRVFREDESDKAVKEGIEYLESLEEKNPQLVADVRNAIFQAELDAKRDELLLQLSNGTIDPFSLFQDYVVMGDSRAVGFWYRDFLDRDRVLADGGHTIRNITAQMDTLVALNPSMIFLCYGLNDISIGYWNSAEEYVAEYMEIIKEIQTRLPNATIVVSSILPARDPAFQRSEKWRNIPEWSAALEDACEANGILFANCDQLAVDHPELWDPDGIHFREAFYPYWAGNLVVAFLMEDSAA